MTAFAFSTVASILSEPGLARRLGNAMVHAIEAYTSRHKKKPLSDALAREALSLLSRHLLRT